MRDYRFDVVRVVCMSYIVVYVHLYAYVHPEVKSAYFIPSCAVLTDACLGLFTFISGFLIGGKYIFGSDEGNMSVWKFHKKRIIRIIPLFILSAVALWLIGFNDLASSINGLLCLSPFIKPRPMTLWYIPVILYCYLITPLISRKNVRWRVFNCMLFAAGLMVLERIVPSVDKRLLFNAIFYMGGGNFSTLL